MIKTKIQKIRTINTIFQFFFQQIHGPFWDISIENFFLANTKNFSSQP